jgi:hypothetical protein
MLEYIPRPWYNTYGYVCNIDLSKPVQVQGVTNLSDQPILQVHSSQPLTEHMEESQLQPSALDSATPEWKETKFKRHIVDNKLNLNLV